jgi:hypothetical protein
LPVCRGERRYAAGRITRGRPPSDAHQRRRAEAGAGRERSRVARWPRISAPQDSVATSSSPSRVGAVCGVIRGPKRVV